MPLPWQEYAASAPAPKPPWEEYAQSPQQSPQQFGIGDAAKGALGDVGSALSGAATLLESLYGIPAATLAKYVTMGGNLAHLTNMNPQQAQAHVQNFLIGQPQGAVGQAMVGAAGLPARVAESVASQAGIPQPITQGALDALSLMPVGGAVRAGAGELANAAEAAARTAASPARAPADVASEAGLAIPPSDNPSAGLAARGAEAITGGAATKAAQARANTPAFNLLARGELLPPGAPMNFGTLDAAKAQPRAVLDAAADSVGPQIPALDAHTQARIANAGTVEGSVAPVVDARADALRQQIPVNIKTGGAGGGMISGRQLVATVQDLRQQGFAGIDSEDAGARALAHTQLGIADALEDHLAQSLPADGPVSIDDFLNARQQVAQIGTLQSALTGPQGETINPAKLKAIDTASPRLLSGGQKIVANAATSFAPSMRPNVAAPDLTSGLWHNPLALGAGALLGAHGGALEGLGGYGASLLAALAARKGGEMLLARPDLEAAANASTNPRLAEFYTAPKGPAPKAAPPAGPELTASPPGPVPPKGGPQGGVGSLADIMSQGVEQPGAEPLSVAPMGTPQGRFAGIGSGSLNYQANPSYNAGDLTTAGRQPATAPENNSDLAGVMSQGVPEGIVQRTSKTGPLSNNASGESAASQESINRNATRHIIDADGNVTTVKGVMADQAKAPSKGVVVDENHAITDRGGLPLSQANGLVNRAAAQGTLPSTPALGDQFGLTAAAF